MSRAARLLGLLLVTLAVRAFPARAQTAIQHLRGTGRDVRMTRIAPGIYQFMVMRDSYVRQLNSIAIVTRRDVLVFDTDTRPSTARIVLERLRRLTPRPVRYVINSHGHPDHWSGNMIYADAYPWLDVIASTTTADKMREMAPAWLPRFEAELANRRARFDAARRTGKRADGSIPSVEELRQERDDLTDYASLVDETRALRRVFPTITYSQEMRIADGGRNIRLISLTGDQEGTTIAWLPKERVLLSGDAVAYPLPYVSGHPSQQVAALNQLAALDPLVIIPGHGPALRDLAYLRLEQALIRTAIDQVRILWDAGVRGRDEIRRRVSAEALREAFAHSDPDLEQRFTARVADLAGLAFDELKESDGGPA